MSGDSSLTAVGLRLELERARVDAEAHPGRPRPIVEDVPEVPAARAADDLGTVRPVARVYAGLDRIQLGEINPEQAIASGDLKVDGCREAFAEFVGLLDKFPFWFNIVTP